MKKRNVLFFFVLMIGCAVFASGQGESGSSTKTYNLIAAHVNNADHSFNKGMEAFKEAVERDSNGRITVSIHGNGELV